MCVMELITTVAEFSSIASAVPTCTMDGGLVLVASGRSAS